MAGSVLIGTNNNDTIYGTSGDDQINALAGNDVIVHNAGLGVLTDYIDGGAGSDTLSFIGGGWTNNIIGNSASLIGIETIDLGRHSLFVEGGGLYNFSQMTIQSGTGNIHVRGSIGSEVIGSTQNNWITGDIDGNSGNDIFRGGDGNDSLFGLEGNDSLFGDSGNDSLDGGVGNDTLWGGAGADLFEFSGGADHVADFSDTEDMLVFQAGAHGSSVTEVLSHASLSGGGVLFDFGNGNTLSVDGVSSLLSLEDNILFA